MKAPVTLFILYFMFLSSLRAQVVSVTVYPGDTNNDSIANVYDLLPIGIAYFSETLPRPAATPDWTPQPADGLNFLTLPVTGVNYAHIDTDGGGFIDALDSELIALNYDSTTTGMLPPRYQPDEPAFASYCPFIRLAFDRDTAMVSDTFFLEIYIEGFPADGVPEPDGVLGAAFQMAYDPLNVKDSLTRVFADTIPGDLMFVHATVSEARAQRSVPSGRIEFAAAGLGENTLRQNRLLGRVGFIVEDMVFRAEGTAVPFPIMVPPNSVLMLNRDEQVFPADCTEQGKDVIILFDPMTASESRPVPEQSWAIYPNPVSDVLFLSGKMPPGALRILDAKGATVIKNQNPALDKAISTEQLPSGRYFVEVRSGNIRQVIPFVVAR